MPATAPLGTGFLAIDTSDMRAFANSVLLDQPTRIMAAIRLSLPTILHGKVRESAASSRAAREKGDHDDPLPRISDMRLEFAPYQREPKRSL